MKSAVRNNRFYNAITLSAGFRTLMAALVVFGFAIAPLAQPPIQKPGSLQTLALKLTSFSNVVNKTSNFELRLTPSALSAISPTIVPTGTGALKLNGTLAVTSGCCARIKVAIRRFLSGPFGGQQISEFCGSQAVNISGNLNINQDDAPFRVEIVNLDAWNKVTVNGSLTLTYPTADKILAPQPNIPIDLTRGVDASRTFTLSPNTPGRLKVEIRWAGGASLQARLFKPGQQPGAANGAILNQSGSSGALDLNYDITPADITAGAQWAVNVLNNSSSSVTATGITFKVIYSVEE